MHSDGFVATSDLQHKLIVLEILLLQHQMSTRFVLTERELEKLSKSKCPIPPNEADRIFALRQTDLLDSDSDDPVFDRFTSLAQRIFDLPIVLVSLVDIERQWFKANIGLDGVVETPRDISFCACKYILHGDNLLGSY